MKKILFILFIFLFNTAYSNSESFEKYKDSLEYGSTQYEANILYEMEKYKNIFQEETLKYTKKVTDIWGDKLITTNKVWVEYSSDMKTRKIMDFETGKIIIQTKADKIDKNKLTKDMSDFISADNATAAKNDILAQNVEKRLKKEGVKSISSKETGGAVIFSLLSDKTPNKNNVNTVAKDIVNNGNVSIDSLKNGEKIVTLVSYIPVEDDSSNKSVLSGNKNVGKIHKKAKEFKEYVSKYATDRKMSEALIFAVIHNESSFNPRATSHVPAYGLMQLVPKSGGAEAAEVYFGKKVVLSPSYFYNSDNNIKLGSTYLSLLYYKYFKDIKNDESRLYCTICAYNTGPTNVAKAFVSSRKISDAVNIINKKSPKEVYDILVNKLPYNETKMYLTKVASSYNAYYNYK